MKFRVGSKVSWDSTANRHALAKEGTVIAKVPAGQTPDTIKLPHKYQEFLCGRHRRFAEGDRTKRNADSYLIAVDKGHTIWLYWPRAEKLSPA